MDPIDYEAAQPRAPKAWRFWLAFVIAYLPGILILNILDDVLHKRFTGNHGDGGVMALSLMAFPVIAIMAGIVTSLLPNQRTVGFAIAFAIATPVILYLLWVLISLM